MATTEDALTTITNAQNQQKLNTLTGMAGTANANTAVKTPLNEPTATTVQTPAAMTTQNRVNEINNMYAAQNAARQAELQSGYNISRGDLQAQIDKLPGQYQQQANANAVDWERQRRNFMEGANMSGVNTGAGAQAELHMMGQQQRGMNTLRNAQANAEAEAGRQMANLTAQYQTQIQKAAADNDYQKAAALLDEYARGYDRDLKNAQIMAEYGDFSGYSSLYGNETANTMRENWIIQNPDIAFLMGLIDDARRQEIKNAGIGGGGGGGGGGGWVPNAQDQFRQQLGSMLRNKEITQSDYDRNMAHSGGV